MKTIHIVIILILVIAIAVVVTTLTDSSSYSNFAEASTHPDREVHIIGKLDKNKAMEYDATKDANRFLICWSNC